MMKRDGCLAWTSNPKLKEEDGKNLLGCAEMRMTNLVTWRVV